MCSKIKQNKRIEVCDLEKLMNMSDKTLDILYRTFIMLLVFVWIGLGVIRYTDYVNFGNVIGDVIDDHYDELVLYNELLGQVYRNGSVTEDQLIELSGYVSVVGLEDIRLIERGYGTKVASDLLVVDRDEFSDRVYRASFVTSLDSSDQLSLDVTGRDFANLVGSIFFVTLCLISIGFVVSMLKDNLTVLRWCWSIDVEITELRKRIVEIEQDEDMTEDLKSVLVRDLEERVLDLEHMKVDIRNTSGV